MSPKYYAQLLYEALDRKSETEQDRVIEKFKDFLIKRKDGYLTNLILNEFEKIQKHKHEENIAYITGAAQLSESQTRELENIFPEPREFSVSKNLVGGISVRKKDIVYNSTLRKKIELLKRDLH